VDALTGPLIGRPKSATYRTADVVGLDTLAHVIGTMQATLPDDPWHAFYQSPEWLTALIAKGALGQKTKGGIFRKDGKAIVVFDPAKQDYRPSAGEVAPEVLAILKNRNPAEKFAQLRASSHPQAQFLWAIFRDVFHYCALHLAISPTTPATWTSRCAGASAGRRALRDLAGRRLAGDCRRRGGRHRRRRDDEPRRCPPGCSTGARRACAGGLWSATDAALKPVPRCRCMAASSTPSRCSAKPPRSRHHPVGERRGAPVDLPAKDARIGISPSSRRCTPSATRCWTACSRPWPAPSATWTAW
jgi:3-hydroxyacyl-CoA dehydrogenase